MINWLSISREYELTSSELNEKIEKLYSELPSVKHSFKMYAQICTRISALSRSRYLLMCYSIELSLKHGLKCIFKNVPANDFDKCVKKYGHFLNKIINEIGLTLDSSSNQLILDMEKSYVNNARYPFNYDRIGVDEANIINNMAALINSGKVYKLQKETLQIINGYVLDIDGKNKPVHRLKFLINNKWCYMRFGGGVMPFIIIILKFDKNVKDEFNEIEQKLKDDLWGIIKRPSFGYEYKDFKVIKMAV